MQHGHHSLLRSLALRPWRPLAVALLFLIPGVRAIAQTGAVITDFTRAQIAAIEQEKLQRTPTQQKINTQLLLAGSPQRLTSLQQSVPRLQSTLKMQTDGRVEVDIDAEVTDELLASIKDSGGDIVNYFPEDRAIRATLPLEAVESIAARSEVRFIRPGVHGETNTGSVDSQGDVAQRSDRARSIYGATGAGIKVGVLSDSIDDNAGSLASAKAHKDVDAAHLTVISGQAGTGEGEGLAMLEIVHDLAPASPLYFATANPNPAGMAANIRKLAAAGCKVIIDDYNYPDEPPFQDGVISKAVNDVTAKGVLFFSCARNSGNKNDGTGSTWEGDFADGGDASGVDGHPGSRFHAFSPGVITNTINSVDHPGANLFWSDPLGHSANDYDLYVVDTNGFVVRSSDDTQNGTQDAYETVDTLNVGERMVVVKFSGANRFIHLDAGRCHISITTQGCVRGHNASGAANAFSVAAVSANHQTAAFTGGSANPVETFSSDGPRRVFFRVNGTPYTPNNFSSTGGVVLRKPDFAAADGVRTTLPANGGLNPFYGTSAAAPHAGAIAAQLLSCQPGLTGAQVREALKNSCVDNEAPGFDRDSGSGILMALGALQTLGPAWTVVGSGDFNGDGKSDILWEHAGGEHIVWLMNGTSVAQKVNLPFVATNWKIAGTGDFNSDRNSDILWQSISGDRTIWLMNRTVRISSVDLGHVAPSWKIIDSGFFNADTHPDILWQQSTGARSVWLMNGTNFFRAVAMPNAASSWTMAGTGDFNGDHKSDILWQSTAGGRAIWLMNGTNMARSVGLGNVAKTWKIVGSGDFNNDGKSDILWENNAGNAVIWIMNGTSHVGTVSLP